MLKNIALVLIMMSMGVSMSGCVALLAGAAGGAGTAVWLGEKVSQDVNAPFDRSIKASKIALGALKLEITKETVEPEIAQIMSKYTDGRTIWIDVRKMSGAASKIEVRVGGIKSDREAADKILKRIIRYL